MVSYGSKLLVSSFHLNRKSAIIIAIKSFEDGSARGLLGRLRTKRKISNLRYLPRLFRALSCFIGLFGCRLGEHRVYIAILKLDATMACVGRQSDILRNAIASILRDLFNELIFRHQLRSKICRTVHVILLQESIEFFRQLLRQGFDRIAGWVIHQTCPHLGNNVLLHPGGVPTAFFFQKSPARAVTELSNAIRQRNVGTHPFVS